MRSILDDKEPTAHMTDGSLRLSMHSEVYPGGGSGTIFVVYSRYAH